MYKINNSEMKNLLGGNGPDNGTLAGLTIVCDANGALHEKQDKDEE